jgi:hypothetical protein
MMSSTNLTGCDAKLPHCSRPWTAAWAASPVRLSGYYVCFIWHLHIKTILHCIKKKETERGKGQKHLN